MRVLALVHAIVIRFDKLRIEGLEDIDRGGGLAFTIVLLISRVGRAYGRWG